MEGGTVGTVY